MAYINNNKVFTIMKVEPVPLTTLIKVGDNLRGKTVYFNTEKDFVGDNTKTILTSHKSGGYYKDFIGSGNENVNEMGYINADATEGSAETVFIQKFTDSDGKWLLEQYTFPDDADIIVESITTSTFWNNYIKLAISVDRELSTTSENPVQNKVITNALNDLDEDLDNKTDLLKLEINNLKSVIYDTVASVEEKTDNYVDVLPIPDSVNLKPLIDNTLSQIAKIEGNSDVYMPNAPDLDDAVIIDSNITKIEAFSQLWDEQWETGFYNMSNGNPMAASDALRNKNYIRVLPNTTYYIKSGYIGSGQVPYIFYYDINKNFISYTNGSTNSMAFTTPVNCNYLNFAFPNLPTPITYNNDISINNGSTNRGYIPYQTKEIAINQTLKGAGNAHDYIVFEEQENGTFNEIKVTNIDSADLGSLNYGIETTNVFVATFSQAKVNAKLLCSKYRSVNSFSDVVSIDKSIYIGGDGGLYIHDNTYTDATTFKNAMSGVILNYELATPTTETIATGLTLEDVTFLINKGGYIKVTETHQNYTSIFWQTYGVNPNLTMAYIVKDFKTEA